MLDVGKGAVEITLQNDSDILPIRGKETVLEQIERALRVGTPFHVETNEGLVLLGTIENVLHYPAAELLGDVEPHRRQLHGDVRVELPLVNGVEHGEILTTCGPSFAFVVNALAEKVERGGDASRVQLLNSVESGGKRFTCDESVGERFGEAVFANEAEDLLLVGEI